MTCDMYSPYTKKITGIAVAALLVVGMVICIIQGCFKLMEFDHDNVFKYYHFKHQQNVELYKYLVDNNEDNIYMKCYNEMKTIYNAKSFQYIEFANYHIQVQ